MGAKSYSALLFFFVVTPGEAFCSLNEASQREIRLSAFPPFKSAGHICLLLTVSPLALYQRSSSAIISWNVKLSALQLKIYTSPDGY